MKSAFVGGEPRPLGFHATEWPHGHAAVGVSAPGATPVLELYHFRRSFFHKNLYGVLVAHPVAPGDGVVRVGVQGVSGFDHGGGAAFGGHGMAAHGIHLGDDGSAESGIGFCHGDGSAEPGPSTAYDQNVASEVFHG